MKPTAQLFIYTVLVLVCITLIAYFGTKYDEIQSSNADHKNISYNIDGENIKLIDGISRVKVATSSSSEHVVRYFGNDLVTDLNSDGRNDVVFLLTSSFGGSGTFYYAVSALNTTSGLVGSDGYLLGDRIAPQTINVSQNPKHKNVIVVNYADRTPGEPMTVSPSIGKSAYLKLNTQDMRWGIVVADFEGESR